MLRRSATTLLVAAVTYWFPPGVDASVEAMLGAQTHAAQVSTLGSIAHRRYRYPSYRSFGYRSFGYGSFGYGSFGYWGFPWPYARAEAYVGALSGASGGGLAAIDLNVKPKKAAVYLGYR